MSYLAELFGSTASETAASAAESSAASSSFAGSTAAVSAAQSAAAAAPAASTFSYSVPAATTTAASTIPWSTVFQGVQMAGSLAQGAAQRQAGLLQSKLLGMAAKSSLAAGAANEDRVAAINRAKLGALRAATGAQGTTMAGSPMLVYLDSVKNAALDQYDAYYQGQVGSVENQQQAYLAKQKGNWGMLTGALGAASTLGSMLLK